MANVKDLMGELTKLPRQVVKVPVLGNVIVQGMTGAQRDQFEMGMLTGKGRNRDVNMANMRAKLVAFCAINEDGTRIWSDNDIESLGQVRADILSPIFTVAQKLSGISEEDADELGQASKLAPFDSSSSASRVN